MISLRSPLWSMGKKFFVAPGGPDHKNMGPHTMGKLVQSSFFMFSSLTLKNLQKSDCECLQESDPCCQLRKELEGKSPHLLLYFSLLVMIILEGPPAEQQLQIPTCQKCGHDLHSAAAIILRIWRTSKSHWFHRTSCWLAFKFGQKAWYQCFCIIIPKWGFQ